VNGRRATPARVLSWSLALALVLVACLLAAGSLGAGQVSLLDLLRWQELDGAERAILMRVRLPRVLLAAVLGGALTVAGIVFQALLRNPLADPYILGVSGGASVGGVLAMFLGAGLGPLAALGVPGMAFLGALGALLLIERVATVGGRFTVHTILLTGVVFNAFCASLIYFIQSAADLQELHAIVFYLMGNIRSDLGFAAVGVLAALTLLATAALYTTARDYNALTLGEEGAAQLGVHVERLKYRTFVIGSLLTALAVSVAGLIGFVGLVVPHLLRLALGPDHRLMLPAGLLGGAAFLVLADLAARWAVAPAELPVGVVTALVGGPFFLFLLRRRAGGYASL